VGFYYHIADPDWPEWTPQKYERDALSEADFIYIADKSDAVKAFRNYLDSTTEGQKLKATAQQQLRGRDLMCWCESAPCHAHVLLEIANESPSDETTP